MGSEIRLFFSVLVTIIIAALFSIPLDVKGVENSTWTLGEEMLTNRTEITASVINDKIYVIGGADYRADGAVDTVEIYDPNTNQWTNGAPLPYVLDHAPSVVYDGKIYVVVAVVLTIFAGIILYLVRLDRKMTRLEKEFDTKRSDKEKQIKSFISK